MKKLVKESLYEVADSTRLSLAIQDEWARKFIEENNIRDLGDIDLAELASFINDNWTQITGLSDSEKDEEGYFPEAVEEILRKLDVDRTSFGDAWTIMRESAEDWESNEDKFNEDDYSQDEIAD